MTNGPSHPNDDPNPPDDRDGVEKIFNKLSEGLGRIAQESVKKTIASNDFFTAVKKNRADVVLKFLQEGGDPNSFSGAGETALHLAAVNNAVDAARVLIEHGANPLLGKKDNPKHVPLEDAVNFNKPEMIDLLVLSGGYVRGEMVSGRTLLHRACEKGKARTVEALLKAGADCNERTENGATPLLIAVSTGHIEVVRLLLTVPEVVEKINEFFVKTDEKKRTAFNLAMDRGRGEIIAEMVKKGFDVNGVEGGGTPPLIQAIEKGDVDLVRVLAEAGADLNKPLPETPLNAICWARLSISPEVQETMIELLIRAGADADIPHAETGMTPLHTTLISSPSPSPKILTALLRYPVEKETRDATGATPLLYAALQANPVYTKQLLDAGADPDGRHGEDARTPLIQAVRRKNQAVVETLLQGGANPALYDGHGKSALSYARETNQEKTVALLERALLAKPQKKPGSGFQDFNL